MVRSRKYAVAALFALLSMSFPLTLQAAQRVTLEHDGLTLVGHLQAVADPGEGVVLMLHGTLAHGRMETMAALQDRLAENGLNSLSVNLSYGIDDREGMFQCDRPITHGPDAHFAELDAWMAWLKSEGYGPVTLLGHSRGGNQVARFHLESNPDDVRALVLIAPSTHDAEEAAASYEAESGMPLVARLDQATELLRMDQPETVLNDVRFLYCETLDVSPSAFLGYYRPDPYHDTPTAIREIDAPTLVILGSEDTVAADLPGRMAALGDPDHLTTVTIDGADHFFRDFFADDTAAAIAEFLNGL